MSQASDEKPPALPAWVVLALDSLSPEADAESATLVNYGRIREAVSRHWIDLERTLLPCLSDLSDIAKQTLFEQALWVAKYYGGDTLARRREARKDLREIDDSISETADKLQRLLRRRAKLKGDLELHGGDNIWDVLERSCVSHPEWHFVVKRALNPFLRLARTHSNPGPDISDFVGLIGEPHLDELTSSFDDATAGRKVSGARVRKLIQFLDESHPHLGVPGRQTSENPGGTPITDAAIASLATALFDLPDPMTEDAVKQLRNRSNDSGTNNLLNRY